MKQDYLNDITEIKSMIAERSRFLSLSGLSGVLAGIYALVGLYLGLKISTRSSSVAYTDLEIGLMTPVVQKLLGLAFFVLLLSIGTAYYLTTKKAKRRNEKIWTPATIKALKSFLLPLMAGGAFGLILLSKGNLYLLTPVTLIFYGLALYSASRFTVRDVGTLGIVQVVLGLCSMLYPGNGIYFLALGFGILHIVYGVIMYYKYDREENS